MSERFSDQNERMSNNSAELREYLGVKLPIAENREGAPSIESYSDYVEDAFSRDMERIIATAWSLNEPILIEGGTSLGKTRTVKKMCAELGYEVYYQNLNNHTDPADLMGKYTPNPDQLHENDPKYVFADGSVTKALRSEDGKIKVLILDEFNAAHPGVIIRLHEVLDAYKTGGSVVLTEDGNETLDIERDGLKIIAITNPAGGGYADREPLDPAQIRRWTYHKLPDELPKETFQAGVLALAGLGDIKTPTNSSKEKFTQSNNETLPTEALREIPGMAEVVPQYMAFHEAAKNMVKEKKIANNQRQKFTFDDREEPRRVFSYISRFYSGDIAKVMQEALQYFYAGKVLNPQDKKTLEEMIRKVHYTPKVNPERQGLGGADLQNPFAVLLRLGKEAPEEINKEARKAFGKRMREAFKLGITVEGSQELSHKIGTKAMTLSEENIKKALNGVALPVIPFDDNELLTFKEEGKKIVLVPKDFTDTIENIIIGQPLNTDDFDWEVEWDPTHDPDWGVPEV